MTLLKKIAVLSLLSLSTSSAFADIKVIDYTKQFIDGYGHVKSKSLTANKNYIVHYELVKQPHISRIFFDGHPLPRNPRTEAWLTDYAQHLPQLTKEFEVKAPEIKSIVHEVQERSQRIFGKEINAKIVLSPSISLTDAVTTGDNVTKYPTVALNMREMVRYSKDELRIVLSHELFHVLQHQIEVDHSSQEPIAGNLYSEGWATYASSLVYPGFDDWKYISYFTKDNSQFLKFETQRKAIIRDLLHDWHARSERKYDKYFSADPYASRPFEPRSGYYIGYLAAKALAEKQSPVKVALINYHDFKKEIKPLLKKMSDTEIS